MIKALFTSATGMNAQATVIDNTSNNLANVNTNGFKKGQADFQDLIYINERSPGAEAAQGLQAPVGLQIGSGARVAGITKVQILRQLIGDHRQQQPMLARWGQLQYPVAASLQHCEHVGQRSAHLMRRIDELVGHQR